MNPATSTADATQAVAMKKPRTKPQRLPPALLSRVDAAAFLTISPSSLDRLSAAGDLPAPVRLGGRLAWGRAELASWVRHGCPGRTCWAKLWVGLRDRAAKRK